MHCWLQCSKVVVDCDKPVTIRCACERHTSQPIPSACCMRPLASACFDFCTILCWCIQDAASYTATKSGAKFLPVRLVAFCSDMADDLVHPQPLNTTSRKKKTRLTAGVWHTNSRIGLMYMQLQRIHICNSNAQHVPLPLLTKLRPTAGAQ